MKLWVVLGAIIFFLGLGSALLGIYAPLPGEGPTRRAILTKLAVFVIPELNAVGHTRNPPLMLLYVGFATMVVGLDVVFTSLILKFWSFRKRH
ncbi:MAG: hypothetical protein WAN44_16630 [Propionibacteriaceae bacterium]